MSTSPAKKTQPPTVPRPIPTKADGRSDIDYAGHTAAEATLILEALLKTIPTPAYLESLELHKLDRGSKLRSNNDAIEAIKRDIRGLNKSKNPNLDAVKSIFKQVAELEFKILNRAGYDAMMAERKKAAQKARSDVSMNKLASENAKLGVIGIREEDLNAAPTASTVNAFPAAEQGWGGGSSFTVSPGVMAQTQAVTPAKPYKKPPPLRHPHPEEEYRPEMAFLEQMVAARGDPTRPPVAPAPAAAPPLKATLSIASAEEQAAKNRAAAIKAAEALLKREASLNGDPKNTKTTHDKGFLSKLAARLLGS